MATNPSENVPLRIAFRVVPTSSSSPSTSAMVRTAPNFSGIWKSKGHSRRFWFINSNLLTLLQTHSFKANTDSRLTSHSLSGARSALQRMILRSLPPPLSIAPPCRTHIVKTLPSWARVCFMIWNVSAGREERVVTRFEKMDSIYSFSCKY